MPEYQASYRNCRASAGRLRRTLDAHDQVTVLAEETGGWFIEASEEAICHLQQETDLVFQEVEPA